MSTRTVFLAFAAVLVAVASAWAAAPVTLYVAPGGSDANPGTEAKPFATLEKARQAVRGMNKEMTGDIVVVLRGGCYRIDSPVVFDGEDSGKHGHNVIYRAQSGETPVISGGKAVVGWKADEKGRWKAPAVVDNFRQLYVGGNRATRAQGKAPAGLELAGDDGYKTTDVRLAEWKNPGDLEFCYVVSWTHVRCKVQSIKREADHAIIAMLQPHFSQAKAKEGMNIVKPDRVYLENALELLDEPGEWYLDRAAKTVYYMPRPGEDMAKVEVIAPAVEKLVELRGTLDQPVHNLGFEGITFAHGSWLLPSKIGLADAQACFVLDWQKPYQRSTGLTVVHNEHLKSPANVVCHAAKSVSFERCTFTQLGGAGLDIEFGSQDNTVVGCRFFDISGSGIQIGDVLKDDHHPDDPRKIVKDNHVENCYIHDCGVDYWSGMGVFAGYTDGTVIAHNEISQLPNSAISVGWGWGEEDAGGGNPDYQQPFKYDTPTPCKNNRIEYNHIHDTMNKTDDGGCVYTLGNQPGTVIRGNYIHNCKNPTAVRNSVGGIYLDEGSGFIEVYDNFVHDVPIPAHYNNKAQNRLATCKEHGNILQGNPPEAKPIVDSAGLDPAYRDLLPQAK
jgi:hypothetical protein